MIELSTNRLYSFEKEGRQVEMYFIGAAHQGNAEAVFQDKYNPGTARVVSLSRVPDMFALSEHSQRLGAAANLLASYWWAAKNGAVSADKCNEPFKPFSNFKTSDGSNVFVSNGYLGANLRRGEVFLRWSCTPGVVTKEPFGLGTLVSLAERAIAEYKKPSMVSDEVWGHCVEYAAKGVEYFVSLQKTYIAARWYVGQRITHELHGGGCIKRIIDDDFFPMHVEFDSGESCSCLASGLCANLSLNAASAEIAATKEFSKYIKSDDCDFE